MEIRSAAFKEGGDIPQKYTCQGIDISPPLSFINIPASAKSLALIMDDPDVPAYLREDCMWVHWVVYNIDPCNTEISEGTQNLGVEGVNTGGKRGYMGPCPPDQEHRYYIKLYALDRKLDLQEGVNKKELLEIMEMHIIESVHLMGRFKKK